MTGRISRLFGDRQQGIIAGEDGLDYQFSSASLVGIVFGMLYVGATVTFLPVASKKRATVVTISVSKSR